MISKGKRRYNWNGTDVLEPGEFAKSPSGIWFANTPSNNLSNLQDHQVEEHPDGTITVRPSILVSKSKTLWHGHLEAGVWKPC